ncbi:MAG TPA: M20/M25/M40 family metallo-hydrolase [Candidatus Aminicenantes bacterium]|nr:M20/M25/M40 family metallo-hydrolase [Candidatus Aminicenantes bacterium]HRY64814.1 M20/M25/M40 family metallo-hydrolase [Candidatus Aminicenantes bacterium]HRZ71727.1 M20/M25/M40 family metallo-hydrolase [Candidatus Aminicenantes bacterium]
MKKARTALSIALTVLLAGLAIHGQVRPADAPDTAMLNRIWLEGTNNSKVMEHMSWITDVFGPRIPGSPAYDQAAAWAKKRFAELGLANAAIEPAGELGLGWSYEYVSAHMTAPSYMPILAYPRPWTGSTMGRITGHPLLAPVSSKADLEKYKGRLKGAIVLVKEPRPVQPSFSAPASRLDDKGLREIEATPIPVRPAKPEESEAGPVKWEELEEFYKNEGVGCLVEPSSGSRSDFGTVKVDAYGGNGKDQVTRGQSPRIIVAAEQYDRICRILGLGVPVTLEIEVRTTLYDKDTQGYNVTAEIPGTDKKDELVMLGGHLDSWTGGTGAVDDASGCAVAMEAMRILKALGVRPRRTIRAAFWTGEEEGFYGSRGYVVRHFGDTDKQSLAKMDFEALEKSWRNPLGDSTKLLAKPDYAKISGYFNYDNGSGRIRGIYLQENFAARPIFEAWMKPLADLGVTAIALQNTEGTDHLPFDYIGIPGFQFIQDPLDYFPGLHHTNQDVYDHAVAEDLVQSAVVMAYFVYQTAMREEMLPRKPLQVPVEMPAKAK